MSVATVRFRCRRLVWGVLFLVAGFWTMVVVAGWGALPVLGQYSSLVEGLGEDELGLIAFASSLRELSLGEQEWEVWTCDQPVGDVSLDRPALIKKLNDEITPYFEWLSGGRYRPVFVEGGHVKGIRYSRGVSR